MGLGDVFTATFSVFRRRTGMFLGLTALQLVVSSVVAMIPIGIAGAVVVGQVATLGYLRASRVLELVWTIAVVICAGILLAGLVAGAISLYFSGLIIVCAHEATQQRFPKVDELRRLSRGFVWRMLPLYLLGGALYTVGVLFAMIPMGVSLFQMAVTMSSRGGAQSDAGFVASLFGAILLSLFLIIVVAVVAFVIEVKLAYVLQVCALENLSGMAALKRAWGLTKDAFWRTLGYLLVFGVAAAAAQQVVSAIGQVIMSAFGASLSVSSSSDVEDLLANAQGATFIAATVAVYVLLLAVQLLILPLRAIYVTVMYGDQVQRRELGPVNHAFGMAGAAPATYAGQTWYPQSPQYGYGTQAPFGYSQQPQPGSVPPVGYGQAPATGFPQQGPYGYDQQVQYGHGQQPAYGAPQPNPYGQGPAAQPGEQSSAPDQTGQSEQ